MSESEHIAGLPVVMDLSSTYGLTPETFLGTVMSTAMPKNATKAEIIGCLVVAREHKLNPLTKEIYFMRTKAGTIQPIVGVDGWIRKANEHPQFDGMEFEDDRDENGALRGMFCRIYRKDRSKPVAIREDLAECRAAGGPAWKTNEYRMMRNRTLCQAVRLAFGFAGVLEPDEFHDWQEIAPGVELSKRKSSAAAKRDGTTEVFNEIRAKIAEAATIEVLEQIPDLYAEELGQMPRKWSGLIEDDYAVRLADLQAEATQEAAA